MRRLHPPSLLSLLLLPPLGTLIGGWAVVSVEDPPEYGVVGTPITLTFAVRQHGVEPLKGLRPVVEARSGRQEARAVATAGPEAGQYRARVTLPEPGSWSVTIRSGFGNSTLTLLPLTVIPRGAPSPAPLSTVERGRLLFAAKGCVGCHVRNELGGGKEAPNFGPGLTGKRFEATFLDRWLKDPSSMGPPRYGKGPMPDPRLQPAEIADFAVYLASDKAKRMTGGIHVVDSGYTAFKGTLALKDAIAS